MERQYLHINAMFRVHRNVHISESCYKGTIITAARHIYPSLVLVQPRKTHPYITERLLMGRKESNQTNKTILQRNYRKMTMVIFLIILCKIPW